MKQVSLKPNKQKHIFLRVFYCGKSHTRKEFFNPVSLRETKLNSWRLWFGGKKIGERIHFNLSPPANKSNESMDGQFFTRLDYTKTDDIIFGKTKKKK